jgi:polygalacturonase
MIKIYPVRFNRFLMIFLFFLLIVSCSFCNPPDSGWDQVPAILLKIVPPDFPDRDFLITRYGAIGDGKSDCSDAIRKAIETCSAAGGGRVVVPKGLFLTGAIHLKSNVNLQILKDAVLLFSRDIHDYLPLVYTRFEGMECFNYSPFIYSYEQENVAITGEGTLDGHADSTAWWPWTGKGKDGWKEGMPTQHDDRQRLMQMAEKSVPVSDRNFGEGHYLRVNFIQLYKCKNILVEGITLRQSPMWSIHPVLCENVTVRKIRIISHGPNNDGCNPESCKNVLIRECYFDTGDDCIAIKSGRNADGRRVNVASENIVVQNCIMKDGHGGVVIGSEISGSCRNVFVENCTMDSPNLERALRIKTNSLRGGVIENIHIRKTTVGEVSDAVIGIFFNYEEGDAGQFTPVVRNIFVNKVTSRKSTYALYLDGYQRSPISNVYIDSCRFSGVEKGNWINHVSNLYMNQVYINGELQAGQ